MGCYVIVQLQKCGIGRHCTRVGQVAVSKSWLPSDRAVWIRVAYSVVVCLMYSACRGLDGDSDAGTREVDE